MSATIAAIATPPGQGGVGIVRVSGPEAAAILDKMVGRGPDRFEPHRLHLCEICDQDGRVIDESLAVHMPGPRSYTGEDVVEFQCHGGPIILKRVLDGCLATGARIADPGEFTQRAFLNGRLDLTQAEAVADLVNATTESAHEMALEHLRGDLGAAIEEMVELLTEAIVLVEAAIDFSNEEHVYQIEAREVGRRIDTVKGRLDKLREQFDRGRRRREGVRVVILGPTNAGKSTLFNALHGTDRAIVTDVAGTTRDFLEEDLHLGGTAIRLIDTAGLRETGDHVESIGIERSRQMGKKADILVWVADQSRPMEAEERRELKTLIDDARPCLVVLNKQDRPPALDEGDRAVLDGAQRCFETALDGQEAKGLPGLVDALEEWGARLTAGEGVLLSRARHLEKVVEALEALDRAQQGLEMKMEHELIAIDLRDSLDALGAITGRVDTEQILGRIFSEFCVGK